MLNVAASSVGGTKKRPLALGRHPGLLGSLATEIREKGELSIECRPTSTDAGFHVQLSPRDKEQFFHELVQLTRSAVPLTRALEMLSRNSRSRTGRCARRVKESLTSSNGVAAAFAKSGFLPGDAAVIEAGEETGRLEAVFSELEVYYRHLADARQRMISRSIYPLVVLHFGAVVLAIPPAIIEGGWLTFWARVLPVLLGFYVVLGGGYWLWRVMRNQVAQNPSTASIILAVPGVGGLLSDWTAWKFSRVLSLYVRAGGGVLKGFEIAGSSSENVRLESASRSVVLGVQAGEGLDECVRKQGVWPVVLERALEVGEQSGRLDEETQRAAEIFKTRTLGKFEAFSSGLPKALYIAVVLLMAWQAVSMITGVMSTVGSALDF